MSQANRNKLAELEKRLWPAADQIWANSSLRTSDYSTPVLGLIFLRFADNAFTRVEAELKGKSTGRRTIDKADYARHAAEVASADRHRHPRRFPKWRNFS